MEGQALHQQKGYFSLNCEARFFTVVWNRTCDIPRSACTGFVPLRLLLPKPLLSCSATPLPGWVAFGLGSGCQVQPTSLGWDCSPPLGPQFFLGVWEEVLQGSYAASLSWEPGVLSYFFPLEFCGH